MCIYIIIWSCCASERHLQMQLCKVVGREVLVNSPWHCESGDMDMGMGEQGITENHCVQGVLSHEHGARSRVTEMCEASALCGEEK